MEDNFNKHLGNKLKLRRLALGLTQTKVAKAINVTFQQIQKYEKGTNGVSSIRLLQLANYLKVPINYFFEDFSEYLVNLYAPLLLPPSLMYINKSPASFTKNFGYVSPENAA